MTQIEDSQALQLTLRDMLAAGDEEALRTFCAEQRPADLAEALERLSVEEKQPIFRLLSPSQAADVLSQYEEDRRAELMTALDEHSLPRVLERLPLDDAADAVADLPEEEAFRVLARMKLEESEEIRELLRYDEETAGGIMTPDVIVFPKTATVGEVLSAFRGTWKANQTEQLAPQVRADWETAYELIREENIYSIFVVDENRKLEGFVRLQDLLRSDPSLPLSEILDTDVIAVRTDEDQEEVADLAQKYDLVSIPVVDLQRRLVGRVTIDDVIDVIEEETTEDMLKMAGTTEDELVTRSALRSMLLRLPWLLAALAGLLLSSTVYRIFQPRFDLAIIALLFPFIPVIGGLSGNTGVQSATIVVRGLATGQIDVRQYLHLVWREVRIGLLLGAVFGIIVALIAFGLLGRSPVAWIVGTAVFAAVTWASLLGVLIPIVIARIGKDPAVASGPVLTSLNDAMSAIIYLLTALLMLGMLV